MNTDRFCQTTVGVLLGILCPLAAQGQTIWYVNDDSCPEPGTGIQADPFCSIQRGIDESVNEDVVIVAPGTYNELINFNGKAIELRSSEGADVTIIDATGLNDTVVRCIFSEPPETILRGFTITGGSGFRTSGGMYIYESSPTILDCVFLNNLVADCCVPPRRRGAGWWNVDCSWFSDAFQLPVYWEQSGRF